MTDVGTHEKGFYGSVKIGFQTPMLQDFIIKGVSEIKKMHPNLNLTLNYAARHELLAGLEANFYDFIFINLTDIKPYSRFKTLSLGTEQYIIATMKKIFSIPDVLEKWYEFSSFIWVLPVSGLAMRDRFDSVLAARGLALPSRFIEMNSPIGGEQIVGLTDAYTLLPLTMIRSLGWPIDSSDISLRFLPEMQLENGIVWLNDTELSSTAKYVSQLIVNKINKNIKV
ncbi:LysR family transcriptional regulator [Acetobacter pasteurianus NBRC 3299]|nr:LysR family transcriptional regulator [Acetobacter pasteurianus NBRC 3299]